jgi:glutamate-1-semialdehyde aminotransferase
LEATAAPGFHEHIEHLQHRLIHGLREVLVRHGVPAVVNGCGGRIGLYLGLEQLPSSLPEIAAGWNEAFHMRCQADLQARGLYGFLSALPFHPEAITLCAAHADADIDTALDRFDDVLQHNPYTHSCRTPRAVDA